MIEMMKTKRREVEAEMQLVINAAHNENFNIITCMDN